MTTSDRALTRLLHDFRTVWRSGGSMDAVLSQFVIETASRASGCWRLDDQRLHLVGFGWAADMTVDVSQGFQQATRSVPLDQTGLGIVKAVIEGQPVIGRRDPGATGLAGSASWIVRFEANSSLAVPIRSFDCSHTLGVLAVSTASVIVDGDELWNTMQQFAAELGR